MEDTIATYNKAAKAYADKFDAIGSRKADIERAFALVEKGIDISVIEWGCGNGRDAEVIAELAYQYVGIDASVELISLARSKVPGLAFRVDDVRTFKVPFGTHLIFAFASLLHFDKTEVHAILKDAHSALAEGGIIYISLKKGKYEKKIVVDEFGPRTFYFYERNDLEEIGKGLYETLYYEENLMKEVPWLTIALKKKHHDHALL